MFCVILSGRCTMPRVEFTSNLKRHIDCPTQEVEGATVAAALTVVFERYPAIRSYVLDDQGALRRHMNIFINDEPIQDRKKLSDTVSPDSTIYILQALSGG